MSVLIVGASVGGLTVAEALRHKGYTGSLRIVGDEPHRPYDRPPLSKEVLTGAWPVERTQLRDEQRLAGLEADWLLGRTAVRLRPADRAVELDDGRILTYDALVIATGLKPRRLPGQPHLAGVHTLRTLDEAVALRRELQAAQRVSVVGAGVLGCEVAAAARTLGKAVTLIDPEPVPMLRTLGPELGGRVADLHRSRGVRVRTGTTVSRLLGENGRVTGIALPGGELVETDLVVLALGSVPTTGWLADSGLHLDDGVRCDSTLRAAEGIYAVGDVARWSDPATGTTNRLETRTNTTEQALVVAANLLGEQRHHRPVPYFWSDQYEIKIQVHGALGPHARIRVLDRDDGRFAAVAEENGTTTAAIGWNHPRGVRTARRHLAA